LVDPEDESTVERELHLEEIIDEIGDAILELLLFVCTVVQVFR